jgi:hypothetical protein
MSNGASGPGPAQTPELIYDPAAEEAVLAAGIDPRLDPEVLEAAIRATLAAWVDAVHERGTAARPAASAPAAPEVAQALLRPGGPGARTRLVIRGPRIDTIEFWRLQAAAGRVAARLIVVVHGARCIEDRDTGEPVSGDLAVMTWFHQFWDVVADSPAARSWRLELRSGPVGRDYADMSGTTFTTGRETVPQYQERTGAAGPPPAASAGPAAPGEPGPVRRFRISCGYFEHDVYTGGGVEITVRLAAAPSWNDAVQLVLPAIFARLTRSTGLSAWRPTIAGLDVRELLA